ncbi:MAG: thiamine diphosphokinase [Lachnospiraceae bacterium]|nr:thiamine diphosphokinase [Lachnospiraceae bacterium]MBR7014866.1 thiamine diphosphokinase [Lachnospiraceae bacterium]
MKKCVIVGGADIRDYGRIRELLTEEMVFIFCDSGLRHLEALGRKPDLIVGDFDSHENPHMDVETIVLPHVKDDTDTVFAVKEALRRGFEEFLLIGVVGGRLDHTLGNVAILLMLDSAGKKAVIADDFSDMEIVSRERALIPDRYTYFSLLNITGTAKGVTIRNALYPLSDAEITCEYPIGVSNEVLPGKTAEVTVKEGRLLIIKVLKEG